MFMSCLIIHYIYKPVEYISSKICADAIRGNNVAQLANKTFQASGTYFILIATYFIIILTLFICAISFPRTTALFLHRHLNTVSLFLFKKRVFYIAVTSKLKERRKIKKERLYFTFGLTERVARFASY